jgi:hypothetical protein
MTGGTGAVGAGLEDAKMERKNWRNEDPFTMMYTLYNLHRYTLDVPVYNNCVLVGISCGRPAAGLDRLATAKRN